MRARAFTLIEVLVSLALLAALAPILLEGGRWILFSTRHLSAWLLARDRGQRVLAFIEPRALHCGLGLSACRGGLRKVLKSFPELADFVQVYDGGLDRVEAEEGVFRGQALALLYARPSGLVLGALGPVALSPGEEAAFTILSGGSTRDAGFRVKNYANLESWGALAGAGMPFYLDSADQGQVLLRLPPDAGVSVTVPAASEFLRLHCDRFFVWNEGLRFQGFESDWAAVYPREEGVLALWCEWRPALQILDLWVLAEGGPAIFPQGRPPEWPAEAPWAGTFTRRTLCVSRASWRLENL